jgi:hypothetical protein
MGEGAMSPAGSAQLATIPARLGWDEMLPTATSSGATTGMTELQGGVRYRPSLFRSLPGQAAFQRVVLSAILPFVSVDEQIFRPSRDAFTVGASLYYFEQGDLDTAELPSIVAVYPNRQTFRFRGDRPARRLGLRVPFLPPIKTVAEEE